MSLAMVYELKEFRKRILRDLEEMRGGGDISKRLDELSERVKALENKYMAMNARLGKRDG